MKKVTKHFSHTKNDQFSSENHTASWHEHQAISILLNLCSYEHTKRKNYRHTTTLSCLDCNVQVTGFKTIVEITITWDFLVWLFHNFSSAHIIPQLFQWFGLGVPLMRFLEMVLYKCQITIFNIHILERNILKS